MRFGCSCKAQNKTEYRCDDLKCKITCELVIQCVNYDIHRNSAAGNQSNHHTQCSYRTSEIVCICIDRLSPPQLPLHLRFDSIGCVYV